MMDARKSSRRILESLVGTDRRAVRTATTTRRAQRPFGPELRVEGSRPTSAANSAFIGSRTWNESFIVRESNAAYQPINKSAASVTRPIKTMVFFENVVGRVTSRGDIRNSLTGCYTTYSSAA